VVVDIKQHKTAQITF